jgi:tetratricopeptide (TPR) repeat protein
VPAGRPRRAQLGQGARALKLFRRALEIEPGNWTALLGQADLQFEAEAWAEAFAAYQNLLTLGAKEKTDKVASSINFRLAEIKKPPEPGRPGRALPAQARSSRTPATGRRCRRRSRPSWPRATIRARSTPAGR